ncbi:UNVERIFIED_CONTAM: hypothetical protein NCL1_53951 [Trichonephila clavipes]
MKPKNFVMLLPLEEHLSKYQPKSTLAFFKTDPSSREPRKEKFITIFHFLHNSDVQQKKFLLCVQYFIENTFPPVKMSKISKKPFSYRGDLRKHMHIHTKEKLKIFYICRKSFVYSALRTHVPSYVCVTCKKCVLHLF